jgi:hypothetical protein
MRRVPRASTLLSILPFLLGLAAAGPAGCRKARSAAPQACFAPSAKKFGDVCEGPCDCASGVCFEFGGGERTWTCTLRCKESSECPFGSRGQKCTRQGVCRT